jgi:translation initiation factor 1 (eIF-1/SUI1)
MDEKNYHIRLQRIRGKKISTVEHLTEIQCQDMINILKKQLGTSGLVKNVEGVVVGSIQGDHRNTIRRYMIDTLGIDKNIIKMHGL